MLKKYLPTYTFHFSKLNFLKNRKVFAISTGSRVDLLAILWYIYFMENVKQIVAKNLIKHRKASGITQADLAEKLNYSDKAISKWERGEALPDLEVLVEICNIYGITLNDLMLGEDAKIKPKVKSSNKHLFISLLSSGLVWLIATSIFVLLQIFFPHPKNYLCFIYAIPVMFIVLTVFTCLWGKEIFNLINASGIIWGCLLCFCLTIEISKINFLYIIGAPLQVLVIIWFLFRYNKTHVKK